MEAAALEAAGVSSGKDFAKYLDDKAGWDQGRAKGPGLSSINRAVLVQLRVSRHCADSSSERHPGSPITGSELAWPF